MNGKKRDSERIKRVMDLLQEVWESNPDMRFFQLIDSIQREYSFRNNEYGKRVGFERDSKNYEEPISYIHLFYLEDTNFEEFLQEYINAVENRK